MVSLSWDCSLVLEQRNVNIEPLAPANWNVLIVTPQHEKGLQCEPFENFSLSS